MKANGFKAATVLMLATLSLSSLAQNQDMVRFTNSYGAGQPAYFLDGVRLNTDQVQNVWPDSIASMTVLKGATAAAFMGTEQVSGVIQMVTKKGRKGTIDKFLMSKSSEYRDLMLSGNENQIVYIINDHLDQEYFLNIDEKSFENIKVLKHKKIPTQFRNTKMSWGVIITGHFLTVPQ